MSHAHLSVFPEGSQTQDRHSASIFYIQAGIHQALLDLVVGLLAAFPFHGNAADLLDGAV
jgi:hypothetical protein